ncbi:hypothetical protein AVEN_15140-1 [Araneus ventricosus]|uniref:Uncharacterized protein n=1 Tax=Araneus ventricosus TaxID=182803 RepID=A0A4Y2KJY9_ARAVE|nr:hypothetical protein AVEN_15140-1 [Araneus ventricosus]
MSKTLNDSTYACCCFMFLVLQALSFFERLITSFMTLSSKQRFTVTYRIQMKSGIIAYTTLLPIKCRSNYVRPSPLFCASVTRLMFPIKGRTGKTHWVFQTPVTIYRQLRRQKLTIDWETHKVKEFLSARRCSTCQSLEHTASHCTTERTFCGFCTENHRITDCIRKRPSCINCRKHNYKYRTNYRTDHDSIDHTCLIYAAKIKSITKNTIY